MSTIETPPAVSTVYHVTRWRIATVACLIVMVFGFATGVSMYEQFKAQIGHLQTKLKDTAQIKYVAVLLDDQQAPALLVTFDPQDAALQLQRLNDVIEGSTQSLQLWAVPANGQARSLGVLPSNGKTLRLPASDQALADVMQLAISVEKKDSADLQDAPSLPYLFTGALVQKAI